MGRRLIEVLRDKPLDAMLMEGTHFGFPDGNPATEYELEDEITRLIQGCDSLVLASFSPQHVDRLVAFIRTAKKTGRTFVADIYTAFIMHLLSSELSLPQPEPGGRVCVYVPQTLRQSIHHKGRAKQIVRFQVAEITIDEITARPENLLMVFRASMLDDFDGELPAGTSCLYSRWRGYLDQPDWVTTGQKLGSVNGELHEVHTSGHIHSGDIVRLVQAINPKTLIPVAHRDQERKGVRCGRDMHGAPGDRRRNDSARTGESAKPQAPRQAAPSFAPHIRSRPLGCRWFD